MVNRALALGQRSAFLRIARAILGVEANADMAPLRAAINAIEAEGPSPAAEVSVDSFYHALRERDPVAAAHALANIPKEGNTGGFLRYPHAWYEGLLARLRQDTPTAHAAFMAARAETEKIVGAEPGNVGPLATLALIDAELGDKEKAIQEGKTACDMRPLAKDAVAGVLLITNLASIYASHRRERSRFGTVGNSEQTSMRAILWSAPSRS